MSAPSLSVPGGKLLKITEYTAAGSHTFNARTKSVLVVLQGNGGSGGGIYTGGRGAGGYVKKVYDRTQLNNTESWTVSSGSWAFKTLSAGVGSYSGSAAGGAGGSASGGDINIAGQAGQNGDGSSISGDGGSSIEGTQGMVSPTSGGTNGARGGGGHGYGGNGAVGFIRFEEFG